MIDKGDALFLIGLAWFCGFMSAYILFANRKPQEQGVRGDE